MCHECEEVARELSRIQEALDLFQDSILHSESPHVSAGELDDIMARLDDLTAVKKLRFEDMRLILRLRGKSYYLKGYLDQMAFSRQLRDLQGRLRSMVSKEAWNVYLQIEELINAYPDRFSKNPPETSREM